MRRLRFTLPAARQIERVLDYIEEGSPQSARNVEIRILAMMHLLLEHPNIGTATNLPGMRRMVVTPYPYRFSIGQATRKSSFTASAIRRGGLRFGRA